MIGRRAAGGGEGDTVRSRAPWLVEGHVEADGDARRVTVDGELAVVDIEELPDDDVEELPDDDVEELPDDDVEELPDDDVEELSGEGRT